MNIIRKGVKTLLLVPLRVVQGAADAVDEAVNGPKKGDRR